MMSGAKITVGAAGEHYLYVCSSSSRRGVTTQFRAMATKGPYDDTWSPWTHKTTFNAPKAMSLQAFKVRKGETPLPQTLSSRHSRCPTCPA